MTLDLRQRNHNRFKSNQALFGKQADPPVRQAADQEVRPKRDQIAQSGGSMRQRASRRTSPLTLSQEHFLQVWTLWPKPEIRILKHRTSSTTARLKKAEEKDLRRLLTLEFARQCRAWRRTLACHELRRTWTETTARTSMPCLLLMSSLTGRRHNKTRQQFKPRLTSRTKTSTTSRTTRIQGILP